jgi:PmbA protein
MGRMTMTLAELTDVLLGAARKAGADAADAMALDGTAVSVDVRKGVLEQAERAEGTEIGLRVLVGQRQACVSASDLSARTIADMAERAVAMAREAPEDESLGLADPSEIATRIDMAALALADPSPEPSAATLEEDARRAEAAALAVGGVSMVDSAGASFGRRRLHLAATNGFSAGYGRTWRSLSCVAITGTGTGMERDWASEVRIWQADLPTAEEIGRRAGERTAARAGARKPPTGRFPVIYDQRVASGLIGHLLSAINGTAIVRGASWARDALGRPVLPPGMTLTEDPLRPRGPGSRAFDAEGLRGTRRDIVADGVLTGWTLDLGTARRLGLRSTASAERGPGSPPSPSVSNVALTPGRISRDAMIAETGTGLLVTSMLGASINATTGDYSRGAAGFWIERGQIAYPVNECTIAGNLRDMLMTLTAADDALAHERFVVPTLRVDGLTIAGA